MKEPKAGTQKAMILAVFRAEVRVSNVTLNGIAFRYTARIAELRQAGFDIATGPTGRNGLVWYRLNESRERLLF
jgi:hypothetical protein